jgi:hypothetical protein
MTALVLESRRSPRPKGLHGLLPRFARFLDDLVSARAARSVPEWQILEVQAEIDRYVSLIHSAAGFGGALRGVKKDTLTDQ